MASPLLTPHARTTTTPATGNEAMLLSRLCGVTLRSRLVPSFHWLCHTPTGAAAGAVILSVVRVVGLQLVWNGLFPWLFHQLLRVRWARCGWHRCGP